jgi:hypothetical protein
MQTVLKINLIFVQLEVNITKFVIQLRFFLKFNLFVLPLVLIGFGVASYVVWRQLSANAEQESLDRARVMLETARAMRTYTTTQIAPLLDREQSRLAQVDNSIDQVLNVHVPEAMKKAIAQLPTLREQRALQGAEERIVEAAQQEKHDLPEREFLPQSIPFYAATEAFNYFRRQYPDYTYKEAALNPTNPRDRTSDWEMDVVDIFRNDPSKKEFVGRRDTPAGPELFISAPIRADDKSCLICHGAAQSAPPELVKLYGPNNGFGWKLDDVIGAQIVGVPARVAQNRVMAAQSAIMIWLAGVFAVLWALVNGLVYVFYKRNEFTPPVASPATSLG